MRGFKQREAEAEGQTYQQVSLSRRSGIFAAARAQIRWLISRVVKIVETLAMANGNSWGFPAE
jgi:hypothetical protein